MDLYVTFLFSGIPYSEHIHWELFNVLTWFLHGSLSLSQTIRRCVVLAGYIWKKKRICDGKNGELNRTKMEVFTNVFFFRTEISIFCSRKIFIFIFFMFFFRNIADCDVILSYVSLASISRKNFENRMKIHDFIAKSYKVVHYFWIGL